MPFVGNSSSETFLFSSSLTLISNGTLASLEALLRYSGFTFEDSFALFVPFVFFPFLYWRVTPFQLLPICPTT